MLSMHMRVHVAPTTSLPPSRQGRRSPPPAARQPHVLHQHEAGAGAVQRDGSFGVDGCIDVQPKYSFVGFVLPDRTGLSNHKRTGSATNCPFRGARNARGAAPVGRRRPAGFLDRGYAARGIGARRRATVCGSVRVAARLSLYRTRGSSKVRWNL